MSESEVDNPVSVEPFSEDERYRSDGRILGNLLVHAERYFVSYIECFAKQNDVTHVMRGILMGWLRDVCAEKQLADDTFILASSLVDRYSTTTSLHRTYYQLVGGACLLIASKLRDPSPISSPEISDYTERTVTCTQLLDHERVVVRALDFDLESVTAWDLVCYVHRLFTVPGINDEKFRCSLRQNAKQFYYAIVSEKAYLDYTAATIAAASIIYALEAVYVSRDNALDLDREPLSEIIETFESETLELLQVESSEVHSCLLEISDAQRCATADSPSAVFRELSAIDSFPLLVFAAGYDDACESASASASASALASPLPSLQANWMLSEYPRTHSTPMTTRANESSHVLVYSDARTQERRPVKTATECETLMKHISLASISSGYASCVTPNDDKENETRYDMWYEHSRAPVLAP